MQIKEHIHMLQTNDLWLHNCVFLPAGLLFCDLKFHQKNYKSGFPFDPAQLRNLSHFH